MTASVEFESIAALYIEMLSQDVILARGTAFVAQARDWHWLITCRHNVTGRDQNTGQPLARSAVTPTTLRIYASEQRLGAWQPVDVDLYAADGSPLWYEHPSLGATADVVALPVKGLPTELTFHPLSIEDPPAWLRRRVTAEVFVVGYPDGYDPTKDGAVAVWTRGNIATEPIVNVGGMPVTLIDSRTRRGQSGSPVFLVGGATAEYENGSVAVGVGQAVRQLFGIYAGRVTPESDLGRVWRLNVIREIIIGAREHPAAP